MLASVVLNGTGRRAILGFTPQAGKTGTNQAYRDAWFIGFTAFNVTGVWFGNDDFSEMKRMTGGTLPAMTWKRYMLEASLSQAAQALPGVPVDESHIAFVEENEGVGGIVPGAPGVTAAALGTSGASRTTEADFGEIDRNESAEAPAKSSDAVVQVLQDMFSFFGKSKPKADTAAASGQKKKFMLFGERPKKKKKRAKKQNIN
jgi:penicillin-binding protein 1A